MDGIHDMGGMDGFGPMVPDDANFHADWERRVYGLARVTRIAGIGSGMFRAAIESMPPAEYLAASYYERWMYGVERRLERDGTLTPAEIDERHGRASRPARCPSGAIPSWPSAASPHSGTGRRWRLPRRRASAPASACA